MTILDLQPQVKDINKSHLIGLKSWLEYLQYINVQPVMITLTKNIITTSTHYGVRYTDPADDATFYYILGTCPAGTRDTQKHQYTTPDGHIFFVSGFYSMSNHNKSKWENMDEFHRVYHPFGSWWSIKEWTHDTPLYQDYEKYHSFRIDIEEIVL